LFALAINCDSINFSVQLFSFEEVFDELKDSFRKRLHKHNIDIKTIDEISQYEEAYILVCLMFSHHSRGGAFKISETKASTYLRIFLSVCVCCSSYTFSMRV